MNIITVNNVNFIYSDGTNAVKNISLSINENEKVALIGHNGSGKSTLLLLLSALLLPTSGSILIKDMPVSRANKASIRKNVGMLFPQVEYQFIMPDLINDIMLSIEAGTIEEKKQVALQWLQKVDLDNMQFHNPLSLSTGQMKRAALAGILAKQPSLLLLDEPLANMDKPSSESVIKILTQIKIPIIFATHSLYAVKALAKRVIVLDKGEITFDGEKNDKNLQKYINKILL